MKNNKFIPVEDMPAKERAILTLLDILDVVREKMKNRKGANRNFIRCLPKI